jgi:WD40 repeat protein
VFLNFGFPFVFAQTVTGDTDPQPKIELRLPFGHSDSVISVDYSPDGRFIALGSTDETIKIWDASDGAMKKMY